MAAITRRLLALLDANGAAYERVPHRDDFRAETTAEDTHTPNDAFAKVVFVWVDGHYAVAVLPASHHLAERWLARALGAEKVRLASEFEMQDLCPDAELGAAPPFGCLFSLPTYASVDLARSDRIAFNAGSHTEAVRMAWEDYARIARPRMLELSRHAPHEPGR